VTGPFESLIQEREPLPLLVLHSVKLVILFVPVWLLMALIGPLIGLGSAIWIYLLFISLAVSVGSALVANRWSESRFVRRAEAEGLDTADARQFYCTYDWDGIDD